MAILPPLLRPPLEEPPPPMAEPDVDVAVDDVSVPVAVRLEEVVTVSNTVLVGGPGGLDVVSGGGVELLGGGPGVLEVVCGGGELVVDVVVGGGGGGDELVVEVVVGGGGGGVVVVGVVLVVSGGGGGVGVEVVSPAPGTPVLVLFDMIKVWRLSRGKFL